MYKGRKQYQFVPKRKNLGGNRMERRADSRSNFECRRGDKLLRGLSRYAGSVYNRRIWL
jgi:hypothetical protein